MSFPTNDPVHPEGPARRGSMAYVARVIQVIGALLVLMFVIIGVSRGRFGAGEMAMVAVGVVAAVAGTVMLKMR